VISVYLILRASKLNFSLSVSRSVSCTALSPSEYARLALSGAVCTVLVRTALNPLELIKTKQQLQSDQELLDFARNRVKSKAGSFVDDTGNEMSNVKVGTFDLLQSLILLRGPMSLFQSADITFLASLVFGSFGFGATELFRRSFTAYFFAGRTDSTELVLLLAAAVATVVTAAAATPFEVLRVRSMGQLQPTSWLVTFQSYLVRFFDIDNSHLICVVRVVYSHSIATYLLFLLERANRANSGGKKGLVRN
jgi:hypothetical protein